MLNAIKVYSSFSQTFYTSVEGETGKTSHFHPISLLLFMCLSAGASVNPLVQIITHANHMHLFHFLAAVLSPCHFPFLFFFVFCNVVFIHMHYNELLYSCHRNPKGFHVHSAFIHRKILLLPLILILLLLLLLLYINHNVSLSASQLYPFILPLHPFERS